MGQHQHDIDELARMERICLDLAAAATMPEERAGLLLMANNYRAEISDRGCSNRFANTGPTRGFFARLAISDKFLFLHGERAGARTQDPVIKSHVLYRLSYALPWPSMALKRSPSLSDIREACLAAALELAWRGKPAVSGSCCRPALCRGMGRRGQ